jgi:hypothetical protein
LVPRNRDLQGVVSRSNTVVVPKRSWSEHFDRGPTPRGWSLMQISGAQIPRQSWARVQGFKPLMRKPFHENTPHATNESWCLSCDYGKQFPLQYLHRSPIFWTATRFSMFVEAAGWKAAVNNSISPFCSHNTVFRKAQRCPNFGP